jgi:hypothetical protein
MRLNLETTSEFVLRTGQVTGLASSANTDDNAPSTTKEIIACGKYRGSEL